MEDYSDNDSICSIDTLDQGWRVTSSGRIIIEEPSLIYTHRCANCFRYLDFESLSAEEKSFHKYRYRNNKGEVKILYFCCKGCRLWSLYKLKRNRHRPRTGCICPVSLFNEGVKYRPPFLHHSPGTFVVVTLEGFNYIEELHPTLSELFSNEIVTTEVDRGSRGRSRSRD